MTATAAVHYVTMAAKVAVPAVRGVSHAMRMECATSEVPRLPATAVSSDMRRQTLALDASSGSDTWHSVRHSRSSRCGGR